MVVITPYEIPETENKDIHLTMLSTSFKTTYVTPGSSAQEKCTADGYPKPTYIWKKNGQVLSNDAQYTINENTGDIQIQNVTSVSGVGIYQCFAQNCMGTVMSGYWDVEEAYLHSFDKVKKTILFVDEFSYVTIPCEHQPSSAPSSKTEWLVGAGANTTFPKTPEDKRRADIDADGTLHILSVNFSDIINNPFICQQYNYVTNSTAVSYEKHVLNLKRVKELTLKPVLKYSKPVNGTIGYMATLLCIFAGNPIPNVEWLKDGIKLQEVYMPGRTSRYQLDPEDYTGRKLIISKLGIMDEGNYTCRATNMYGTNEGIVNLMVTGPPQWNLGRLRSLNVSVGETALFQCDTVSYHANSSLPMWWKNGEPMIGLVHETVIDNRFHFSADLKQFAITNVQKTDTMCVQCNVNNTRKPKIVERTVGNACLTVWDPHTSATPELGPWFIALVIIIFPLIFVVRYLYNRYSERRRNTREVMTRDMNSMIMDTLLEY